MAKTPLESVQACWDRVSDSPVYKWFFSEIRIVSASHGTVTAELLLSPKLLNSKGGLHGSVSATIVDWAGGMAIASTGLEKTGLSTDIHVSYVGAAKEGDTLTIEGNASKVGRNMGFTTVTIFKGEEEEKQVVAHGTHTKIHPERPREEVIVHDSAYGIPGCNAFFFASSKRSESSHSTTSTILRGFTRIAEIEHGACALDLCPLI